MYVYPNCYVSLSIQRKLTQSMKIKSKYERQSMQESKENEFSFASKPECSAAKVFLSATGALHLEEYGDEHVRCIIVQQNNYRLERFKQKYIVIR